MLVVLRSMHVGACEHTCASPLHSTAELWLRCGRARARAWRAHRARAAARSCRTCWTWACTSARAALMRSRCACAPCPEVVSAVSSLHGPYAAPWRRPCALDARLCPVVLSKCTLGSGGAAQALVRRLRAGKIRVCPCLRTGVGLGCLVGSSTRGVYLPSQSTLLTRQTGEVH